MLLKKMITFVIIALIYWDESSSSFSGHESMLLSLKLYMFLIKIVIVLSYNKENHQICLISSTTREWESLLEHRGEKLFLIYSTKKNAEKKEKKEKRETSIYGRVDVPPLSLCLSCPYLPSVVVTAIIITMKVCVCVCVIHQGCLQVTQPVSPLYEEIDNNLKTPQLFGWLYLPTPSSSMHYWLTRISAHKI